MLSNKISSAIRTATNAIPCYKAFNILINDCFETTFENEQKLSIEKKTKNNSSLYGRPILIKDYFCLRDTLTICVSKMLANFRACILYNLKKIMAINEENNAIVLHLAGGTAAVVAANFLSIASGSDTGGSTQNPVV